MQKVYLCVPVLGLLAALVQAFRVESYVSVCLFLISASLLAYMLYLGGYQGREVHGLKEELEAQRKRTQELDEKLNQVVASVRMELGI